MAYRITKTYGHDLGLSACFRQPRATSHCRFLHGYALAFKFVFEADTLDENGWVLDFGSLKPVKAWLCDTFDHKLLVAQDDPERKRLEDLMGYGVLREKNLADVLVVPRIGCESFAGMAFDAAMRLVRGLRSPLHMPQRSHDGVVRLVEVECREHGANGASYRAEY